MSYHTHKKSLARTRNIQKKNAVFSRMSRLFSKSDNKRRKYPQNGQKSHNASPYEFYSDLSHSYVQTPGKAVWSAREYKKFADEAYSKNVIAHRAIAMIATSAASVPWQLQHVDADGTRHVIARHPLLTLLSRPNPCCSGVSFFESVYSYKLLSGNSYLHAIAAEDSRPAELHALRPDRVQVIAGKDSMPIGYRYTIDKHSRDFMMDRLTGRSPILHMKCFHPLHDWYGLSPVEAAAYSIDQHNQAGQWNQSLLQNGARPSGALVVKMPENHSGMLSEQQYQRLKSQLDDQYSGALNAGRPLLLEGGLEWREMSLSPKDMDFLDMKHSAARDIALAFGVPPQLLGIPGDNTFSNLAEARLALWEQTILPLLDNMVDALNHWLVPQFGESLQLSYDENAISALALRREKVWERIENASFLTLNEKRRAVGLGALEEGDGL